jgi:hypothetical protein
MGRTMDKLIKTIARALAAYNSEDDWINRVPEARAVLTAMCERESREEIARRIATAIATLDGEGPMTDAEFAGCCEGAERLVHTALAPTLDAEIDDVNSG